MDEVPGAVGGEVMYSLDILPTVGDLGTVIVATGEEGEVMMEAGMTVIS